VRLRILKKFSCFIFGARMRVLRGSLYEYPDRYIIEHQLGLIYVIRPDFNAGDVFSFCATTAASAISGEYAWYTVTVSESLCPNLVIGNIVLFGHD
jgi:hypothetical protein